MTRSRSGAVFTELLAALIGVGLIGTLITGAYGAVRHRQGVENASARLEEAQNLLARWRVGAAPAAPGWTAEVRREGAAEVLTLRGHGLRLSSLRPAGGGP